VWFTTSAVNPPRRLSGNDRPITKFGRTDIPVCLGTMYSSGRLSFNVAFSAACGFATRRCAPRHSPEDALGALPFANPVPADGANEFATHITRALRARRTFAQHSQSTFSKKNPHSHLAINVLPPRAARQPRRKRSATAYYGRVH
jgi:hypothetical protein